MAYGQSYLRERLISIVPTMNSYSMSDTRIQSLISPLYVTGDDRLMRKAIVDFYNSRVPEPAREDLLQVISPVLIVLGFDGL